PPPAPRPRAAVSFLSPLSSPSRRLCVRVFFFGWPPLAIALKMRLYAATGRESRARAAPRGPFRAALPAGAGWLGGVLRPAVPLPRRTRRFRHRLHNERTRPRSILESSRPLYACRGLRRGRRRGAPLRPVASARPPPAPQAIVSCPAPYLAAALHGTQPDRARHVARRRPPRSSLRHRPRGRVPLRLAAGLWAATGAAPGRAVRADAICPHRRSGRSERPDASRLYTSGSVIAGSRCGVRLRADRGGAAGGCSR